MELVHSQNTETKYSNFFIQKTKQLAHILGSAYQHLNQLAQKATVRKPQLLLYQLASDIYEYYFDLVIQTQLAEKKIFHPFIKENSKGDVRVISFNHSNKTDNTSEIFSECHLIKSMIEGTYDKLLRSTFIAEDQKEFLEYQLKNILISFLRLKTLPQ